VPVRSRLGAPIKRTKRCSSYFLLGNHNPGTFLEVKTGGETCRFCFVCRKTAVGTLVVTQGQGRRKSVSTLNE
jgi:hypothetical protein